MAIELAIYYTPMHFLWGVKSGATPGTGFFLVFFVTFIILSSTKREENTYNYNTLIIAQTETKCLPNCHLFTLIREDIRSCLSSHLGIRSHAQDPFSSNFHIRRQSRFQI